MPTPWKVEWALADSFGDEFAWHDEQEDAMREAEELVDSGKYEELTLVRIERYFDEREDSMLYSSGAWDS